MWRHIASNLVSLSLVVVFLIGGVILWAQREYEQPGPLSQQICLRVAPGSNMSRVSQSLEEQEAITHGWIFRSGADYSNKAGQLKAGSFLVPEGSSMAQIVDIVTRGGASTCGTEVVYRISVAKTSVLVREIDPQTDKFVEIANFDPVGEPAPESFTRVRGEADTRYRVTLAEGVTSWQVVEGLKGVDVMSGTIAAVPPEGTLSPDSYEVREGDDRQAMLTLMQQRQEATLSAAWQDRVDGLPIETKEEALVLASIIEKETGIAEERRQVASVFVNRLRKGMPLQTDPTVIYGITEGKGVLGRGLRQSELRKETPFNTYVINGLPPSPIANPGEASIKAALDPAETEYIYFVADGTGGHAFAKTLDEHNANVAKWRRIEADTKKN